jgi:hypothetical protein
LQAPTDSTTRRNKKKILGDLAIVFGVTGIKKNVASCLEVWKRQAVALGEDPSKLNLAVEADEDESGLKPWLGFVKTDDDEDRYMLMGSCGETNGQEGWYTRHKLEGCNMDYYPTVACDDADAEARCIFLFGHSTAASYLRVIVLRPQDTRYASLPVFVGCTCNCFDHEEVRRQWNILDAAILSLCYGLVWLVGHGSDGDARRFKLMEQDVQVAATSGESRYSIDTPSHTCYATKVFDANGVWVSVKGLNMQDPIHNHKKGDRSMDGRRILMLGSHIATMNDLQFVFDGFCFEDHDLRTNDCAGNVKDAMNWAACNRRCSLKTLKCLREVVEERGVGQGTLVLLEMWQRYILIFYGQRVTLAGKLHLSCWYFHTFNSTIYTNIPRIISAL